MWTIISLFCALGINFAIPSIPENHKFIKTDNYLQRGFPFNYYEGENLTEEEVNYRIRVIYISSFIGLTVIFTLVPIVKDTKKFFPVSPEPIEKLVTKSSSNVQEKILLDVKGGSSNIPEFIIKFLLIWTMSKNSKSTEAFQPKLIIHQQGYVQLNPRIAPKLQENPVDRNNLGQGGGGYKANQHTSMDAMSNSLNPEFSQYQNDYYPKSLPPRFDTTQCPSSKFNQLAHDSVRNKYTRISIDEARAVVQAELKNVVIEPTRANQLEARRVDLDFKVQGPHPWTHVDIKQPIGSEALIKQGQTISVEDMAYKLGQKIVAQKHRFVGLEKGPVGPENVGHIVDLCYVPSSEKAIVKEKLLQGAVDKGSIKVVMLE